MAPATADLPPSPRPSPPAGGEERPLAGRPVQPPGRADGYRVRGARLPLRPADARRAPRPTAPPAPRRPRRPGKPRRLPRARRLRGARAGVRARARGRDPRSARVEARQGRGGAAFPAGRKWDAVAKQPAQPHYLVCNADESEPGTFKDRVLMEEDPFAVVEAMTIVAFATGCEHGYVYIRGEYPLAIERVEAAIAAARRGGFLGDLRRRAGRSRFDIEVRRGAGAYICGEETALFNSIEGFRGEPRNKPPFPVEKGLFGKPTVINNVETLVKRPADRPRGRRGVRGDRHRASRPGRSSSACRATSRGPASTRSRSARRSGSSSTRPAASPAAGRSAPCSSAARPAPSSVPRRSTCR